jgi:hypothetical protein
MSYPVFVSGEVLNASDMNAVGLWLVKQQTIGSAVANVTVSDCFNADYDAYKIVVTGGVGTDGRLKLQMGSTTTGYYWGLVGGRYDGGGSVSVGGANAANWEYVGIGSSTGLSAMIELNSPFLAKRTTFTSVFTDPGTGGGNVAGPSSGMITNTLTYTSFVLIPASGTFTGGTISVYGYKKV